MKCVYCNKETRNPKFCSKSCSAKCSNKGRNRHGIKPKKYCKWCNVLLSRTDYQYCTIECRYEYNTNVRFQKGTATSTVLKTYLLKKFGSKCFLCGWDKINLITQKCPIELDHIDGNSDNNTIENGRLLCPSCHSLQPTYKALNKGKGRYYRRSRYKNKKSY